MKLPGRPKALNQVVSLPVGSILPSPHQPRRDFNLDELDILARSISQNGLLAPITVRKDPAGGGRYFLIAGERRLLACRRLGYDEIPAIITTVPEANAAVLTLIENLHRQDLNCFEEAEGIYALMKESGLSQQKVCAMLAKPQPTVANKLRLLRLDPQVRQFLTDHGLGERIARALLPLEHTDRQLRAARHILQNQMSARQAESYISTLLGPKKGSRRAMGYLRDLRILFSPVDKAVEEIKRCGISVQAQTTEEEDFVCYTIRVPKKASAKGTPRRETVSA
ncbi:MAG: ParB/RepB/Spo0J family partition protein [Angelakisella sp.]|jgi:ParB family chromosome partitioning protein|nr:ParB/RepB/Spo0J family partition protein [Angelakisella sp.]